MSNSEPNSLSVTYRQGYRWAAAELLASLPSLVLSGWLLVGTAALLANWVAVLVLGLWLGSGPLVLWWRRLVLAAMAQWSAQHLPDEHDRVRRAWVNVTATAGLPVDTARVWVMNSGAVNGALHSGGQLSVTRQAVDTFTQHQLEALLAHELGHRLQGTATWRYVIWWYRRPFEWLVRALFAPADLLMGRALPRLTVTSDRVIASLRWSYLGLVTATTLLAAPAVLAYGCAACLVFVAFALLLGPWTAAIALSVAALQLLIRPRLWQRGEYLADRVVADLGYLAEFRVVLHTLHHHPNNPTRSGEVPTLLSTHPHLDARLAELDRYTTRTR
ncbi:MULTISPECIES: M48 family metalloprotease [unclassified Nocardia]|uniref:M48 family metalloprotease n=1 Tax=unclassified Nocardia TaxID=2637762 RepID=UPI0033BCF2B9